MSALKNYKKKEYARLRAREQDNARRYLAQKRLEKENEKGQVICFLNAIGGSFIFCALFGIASGLN